MTDKNSKEQVDSFILDIERTPLQQQIQDSIYDEIAINKSIHYNEDQKNVDGKNDPNRGLISPLVKISDVDLVRSNYIRARSIFDILVDDVIGGNFVTDDEDLKSFWKDNLTELKYLIESYFFYGFGAAVVNKNQDNKIIVSTFAPQTITIERVGGNDINGTTYTVVENSPTAFNKKYQLLNTNDENWEGKVLWIGSSLESNFYDRPKWTAALNEIKAAISGQENNLVLAQDSYIPKGLLVFSSAPAKLEPGEPSLLDSVKNEYKRAKTGLMIISHQMQRYGNEQGLKTEYISFPEKQHDWILENEEKLFGDICSAYCIPDVRFRSVLKGAGGSSSSIGFSYAFKDYVISLMKLQQYFTPYFDLLFTCIFNELPEYQIDIDDFEGLRDATVTSIYNLLNVNAITIPESRIILKPFFPELDSLDDATIGDQLQTMVEAMNAPPDNSGSGVGGTIKSVFSGKSKSKNATNTRRNATGNDPTKK